MAAKMKKKKNIFSRIGKSLKERSKKAKKQTLLLLIFILIAIINGIVGAYLYTPTKETYVAQTTYERESRRVYDYPKDSQERKEEEKSRDEALEVYSTVMDKYSTDTNFLVSDFIKIHSIFVKCLIWLVILLPYLAIILMFIGHPVNFMFAFANIIIVYPIKAGIYLFKSFREQKTEASSPKHEKKLEVA